MDDIERLVRAARPTGTLRDDPLSDRAVRDLARITARGTADTRHRTPRPTSLFVRSEGRWTPALVGILGPLVAFLVVVIAIVTLPSPPPAHAYGPRPLEFMLTDQDTRQNASAVLGRLRSSSPTVDSRHQRSAWWVIEIRDGRPPARTPAVDTNISDIEWHEDGRAHLVQTASEAMLVDGSGMTQKRSDGLSIGDVISDETFGPGEYQPLVPALPAREDSTEKRLAPWGLTPDSAAGAFAALLPSLLSEWNASSDSQAVLFDTLQQLHGFTVAGDTVDRFGRPGIAFVATNPDYPTRRWIVIMSSETGRFLSIEQMTVGQDAYIDVPDGTVIDYTAWLDED